MSIPHIISSGWLSQAQERAVKALSPRLSPRPQCHTHVPVTHGNGCPTIGISKIGNDLFPFSLDGVLPKSPHPMLARIAGSQCRVGQGGVAPKARTTAVTSLTLLRMLKHLSQELGDSTPLLPHSPVPTSANPRLQTERKAKQNTILPLYLGQMAWVSCTL